MSVLRLKLQLVLTFCALFIGLSVVAFLDTAIADETGTRAQSITHSPTDVAVDSGYQQRSTEYTSPEFTAQFKFNGIGLTWRGDPQADVSFSVQVDGKAWETVELVGDEGKSGSEPFVSMPVFTNGRTVRYRITGATERVKQVELTYFDSTVAPYRSLTSQVRSLFAADGTTETGLTVTTRSQWGADETMRTWEPEYSTPKKIVVHHTAGTNGSDNPAATIRGIYYWHSTILGWGDIGYNYLIDSQGTVYEGRYGGNGVIGAHAYNSDKNINYNVGSIGIALLGCYESTKGACSKVDTFTSPMQASLTNLIAHAAARNHFDPNGHSVWHGDDLPNVVGHRDIDYTYCPGNVVHDALPTIRAAASQQASGLTATYSEYVGALLSSTLGTSYATTDSAAVELVYQNTGAKTWESEFTKLKITTGKRQVTTHLLANADPQSNATVQVGLALPKRAGSYPVTAKLVRKGKTVQGSVYRNIVTITNSYAVNDVIVLAPAAIHQGWVPTITFTATNRGTVELPIGTKIMTNKVIVATTDSAWPVGETRTFTFPVSAASTLAKGNAKLRLKLQVGDIYVEGSTFNQTIRVD